MYRCPRKSLFWSSSQSLTLCVDSVFNRLICQKKIGNQFILLPMMKTAWAMFAAKRISQAHGMVLQTFRVLKILSVWCLMNNKFCHKVNATHEVSSKESLLNQINIKKPVTRLKQAAMNITMSTVETAINRIL